MFPGIGVICLSIVYFLVLYMVWKIISLGIYEKMMISIMVNYAYYLCLIILGVYKGV